MVVESRYNLPTAVNARDFIPPAVERAKAGVVLNTPVPSTKLNLSFNPINTVVQENKFMQSLNRLQEPITRLQDLGNNGAGMVRDALLKLNPINSFSGSLYSQVSNKFNQVSSAATRALGLPIIARMSTTTGGVFNVSQALDPLKNTVNGVFNTGGLNLGNSTIGLAAGGILLCGVLSALMKIDINSLLSQMLQMQRTALAKLDKAISNIVNVVKKPLDELASLIPEVDIPEEVEMYAKMVDNAYKSVVAKISKFTNKLNNVLQGASNCLNALNTVMGMVGLLGGIFGLPNVFRLDNVQKLKSYNNLGNISNINYEISKVYPELVQDSMREQTSTNKEVANKDLDVTRDQSNEELEKQRDIINNQVAQDILDISFDELVEEVVTHVKQELQDLIDRFYQFLYEAESNQFLSPTDKNYVSDGEFQQVKQVIEELVREIQELRELIEQMREIPDSNREIIQKNAETMNDVIDQIKEDVNKTLDEQQENLNEIYKELESNADSVDKDTVTEEPVDTSCRT